jgi:anti-repressor protein
MDRNGEPWFLLADICAELDIANSRDAASRLDDEKHVVNANALGGVKRMTVINESGLYSLILTSRKAQARRFKKWVTSEMLPSIRRPATLYRARG